MEKSQCFCKVQYQFGCKVCCHDGSSYFLIIYQNTIKSFEKKSDPTLVYTVELFWIELYKSICDTLSWFTLVNCVKAENL